MIVLFRSSVNFIFYLKIAPSIGSGICTWVWLSDDDGSYDYIKYVESFVEKMWLHSRPSSVLGTRSQIAGNRITAQTRRFPPPICTGKVIQNVAFCAGQIEAG